MNSGDQPTRAMRFPVERLEQFVSDVFSAIGVAEAHADTVAERLIEADLRGRTGHGLMRVRRFGERVLAGGVNLEPAISVLHETPVSALVDGDNGLGPVVMTQAAEIAVSKARASGLSWVGTRRSNHAGAAGIYPALALREGLGALYMAVGADNSMPPWGGRERLLGTNPLAVAIPAGDEVPFQLDMATTVASQGNIRVKAAAGETLPEGWVVDADGRPITDPNRVSEGYLAPIGGHKGAGLNVMIGLMAGVMNGAGFGRELAGRSRSLESPADTGQAMIVFRPDLFSPAAEFREEMDRRLGELRSSAGVSGRQVRLPGQRAVELEREQRRLGIPVPEPLRTDLAEFAGQLGVADRLD